MPIDAYPDAMGSFQDMLTFRQGAEANELQLGMQKTLMKDQMVARAARMGSQSAEAWDQAFSELAQQYPEAQRYIGQWSPFAADELVSNVQAAPARAAAAQRDAGGGGGIDGAAGPTIGGGASGAGMGTKQPTGSQVDLSTLDPEDVMHEYDMITKALHLLSKVRDPQSFDAAVDQFTAIVGPESAAEIAKYKGRFNEINFAARRGEDSEFMQWYKHLVNWRNQLAEVATAQRMGVPTRGPQPGRHVQMTEAGPMQLTSPVGGGDPTASFIPVTGSTRSEFNPQPRGGAGGGKAPSGYTWGPIGEDGQPTLVPIPGGPADKTGRRVLPQSTSKELSTFGDQFATVQRSAATFKPEFASQGIAGRGGDTALWAGRTLGVGASQAAVDWWQAYDRYKNTVRNELFGAALTPNEEANFEKTDINANMRAETIRANLRTQKTVLENAMKRRGKALVTQGYNSEAIEQLTNLTLDQGGAADMTPQPLPADPAALVVDTVYETKKGPARYRGNGKFEPVR